MVDPFSCLPFFSGKLRLGCYKDADARRFIFQEFLKLGNSGDKKTLIIERNYRFGSALSATRAPLASECEWGTPSPLTQIIGGWGGECVAHPKREHRARACVRASEAAWAREGVFLSPLGWADWKMYSGSAFASPLPRSNPRGKP